MSQSSVVAIVLLLVPFSLPCLAVEPLPPKEAAASIKVPTGFKATLFAGEPDISQPMSVSFDDRGRMWVVECRSYPSWNPTGKGDGADRILILEDQNGDEEFDKKTVFLDKGVNFSSVECGFGGVFVMAIPNLLFFPDNNRDDVPDGPPEVLIDGFDTKALHNAANSLVWGPDGWLYGCNGILSNSRLGKPGTPDAERIPMNCGIWRYHPVRRQFEVVAHGTTNPWGVAFDERGEGFLTNCVIEHAFHVVPGARFKRMFGQDFNPFTFELMQTCADHIHWAGGTWEGSRDASGKHGEAGGGHAHSGAMIYLGDQFPNDFRNCLFTLNIHGQRLNRDKLERFASGYVAKHLPDFAPSGDPWFRGVCVREGLDGSIYFSDWSDTGECHNYYENTIHRENGRIFKVRYGTETWKPIDFAKLSDAELIEHLSDRAITRANVARRILQERAAGGKLAAETPAKLLDLFVSQINYPKENSQNPLQLLWTIEAIGQLPKLNTIFPDWTAYTDDTVRGWIVRLHLQNAVQPDSLAQINSLAKHDPSPYVRLQIASGLQRLSLADRYWSALELVDHAEIAEDNNLTLMLWYGIEPLISANDWRSQSLAIATQIPKIRQFIARRFATGDQSQIPTIVRWLEEVQNNPNATRDILTGFHAAIEGRRDLKANAEWNQLANRYAVSSDATIRELSQQISLIQGSDQAFNYFVGIVNDARLDAPQRERALASLVITHRPAVADILLGQLNDPALRAFAIRGLAGFDRKETAGRILELYPKLTPAEKMDAISTLVAREKTATDLLQAIERGAIDKLDLSEFDIRQLQRYKNPQLKALVDKQFGAIPTSAERAQQIAEMKQKILSGDEKLSDAKRGHAIFQKNCASCHVLFGEGRQIGPDLTGAQRTDLDYVLINVMDPSALVGHAYRVTILELKDGRVMNGIVKAEDANTLTVQTATDRVVVSTQDIEARTAQPISMMPEGLLNRLSIQEVRDLVKYLASPEPVSQPQ